MHIVTRAAIVHHCWLNLGEYRQDFTEHVLYPYDRCHYQAVTSPLSNLLVGNQEVTGQEIVCHITQLPGTATHTCFQFSSSGHSRYCSDHQRDVCQTIDRTPATAFRVNYDAFYSEFLNRGCSHYSH